MQQLQIDRYLACGGLRCPFCNSDQIEGDEWDADSGSATQEVGCKDCGESWLDVYKLMSIERKE